MKQHIQISQDNNFETNVSSLITEWIISELPNSENKTAEKQEKL